MFREIEIVDTEGETITLDINVDNIVFVSEVDLPSNVVGLDGQPKTNKGSALALANGMMLNSPMVKKKLLKEIG